MKILRDLRALGGYQPGKDSELDRALQLVPKLYAMLGQSPGQPPNQNIISLAGDLLKPTGKN